MLRNAAVLGLVAGLLATACDAAEEKMPVDQLPVRKAALAGSWYPESKNAITIAVHRMLRATAAAPSLTVKPKALVLPHAGWRYSGPVAAAALRNLQPGQFSRVVLIAPSHRASFTGFSVPLARSYETPI